MAKKKEVVVDEKSDKKDNEAKSQVITPGKPGKISEFFNHLIAYGGFNFNDGVMLVWGDPSLFIPSKAFVNLFRNLENKMGAERTHEIFYWLGKLYGKNCTLMLKDRFCISKSDIPNFVNGATQDGFGYMQIKYYDAEKAREGEVRGTNSRFAIKYASLYGNTSNPLDYYIAGILAGGSEPLFDLFIDVKETDCM